MMENQEPLINIDSIKINFSKRDIYWEFIKNQKNKKYKIKEPLFNKIIKLIHERIMNEILENNMIYVMPHLRYRVKIVKTMRNCFDKDGKLIPFMFPVDWKETRKLWKENPEAKANKKIIYILNDHTDGHIYRIKMMHPLSQFKNSMYYKLRPTTNFRRSLAKILKDPYNKKDYYEQ